jgi:hypothetical protein
MIHQNVFYINVPPYSYFYSLPTIIDKLHKCIKLPKQHFNTFMNTEFQKYDLNMPSTIIPFDLLSKIKFFVNTYDHNI